MDRQEEIVNQLLDNASPISINVIASNIKVSNKTVRNDLHKIEGYIKNSGLILSKKPGVGVSIEGSEEKKAALRAQIKGSHEIELYSPEDRKDYILRRLFISEEKVTLTELASELYVSRVTIHNDLKGVEKWLSQYNLKLLKKTNYGIEITGDEENWRNAAASLIIANKGSKELKKMLVGNYPGRIDYKTISPRRM